MRTLPWPCVDRRGHPLLLIEHHDRGGLAFRNGVKVELSPAEVATLRPAGHQAKQASSSRPEPQTLNQDEAFREAAVDRFVLRNLLCRPGELEEFARDCGLPAPVVLRFLEQLGPPPMEPATADQAQLDEQVERMRGDGMKLTEIAEALGESLGRVQRSSRRVGAKQAVERWHQKRDRVSRRG